MLAEIKVTISAWHGRKRGRHPDSPIGEERPALWRELKVTFVLLRTRQGRRGPAPLFAEGARRSSACPGRGKMSIDLSSAAERSGIVCLYVGVCLCAPSWWYICFIWSSPYRSHANIRCSLKVSGFLPPPPLRFISPSHRPRRLSPSIHPSCCSRNLSDAIVSGWMRMN